MFHRVGPGEVIKPSLRTDIPEHRSPVDVTSFTRSVNVVEQFMVIRSVKARDVPMPFAEVLTSFEKDLVVFPNPDDRGSLTDHSGSFLHGIQSHLVKP